MAYNDLDWRNFLFYNYVMLLIFDRGTFKADPYMFWIGYYTEPFIYARNVIVA